MNTTEINGKEYLLTEGEGGKLTLTPLINEPEQRTPEAGDVWEAGPYTWLMQDGENSTLVGRTASSWRIGEKCEARPEDYHTYLGKFDEVYVKRNDFIADVRDALSFKDREGEDMMNYISTSRYDEADFGRGKTLKALAKLGIK